MSRTKRRLLVGIAALAAITAAGCSETYKPVNRSDPPQVIVRDGGDGVDGRNLEDACSNAYGPNFEFVESKWAGDDQNTALVTCKENK